MRDFFYNRGDILVAILIIVVAATVIYFRVGIVMGTDPGEGLKNLFAPLFSSGQSAEETSEEAVIGDELQEEAVVPEPEQDTTGMTAAAEEDASTDPIQQAEEPPTQAETPPEQPSAGAASVTITVNAGDAASTIGDKLLAAGAISDKQAFLSEVMAQGADSRLRQGTFTIPAGSAIKDIIALLVG